jgi:c(7)-type cytochrome triheme protein
MKGGETMKKLATLMTILAIVAFVGTAFAVAPGKTVDFDGGPMGKVTFDGKTHADAGNKCMDCHPKAFPMKAGGTDIKAPHKDTDCFICHTGAEGKPSKTCTVCHKK